MAYLLMALEDADGFETRNDPGGAGSYWSSWQGCITALTESGGLRGAGGLDAPAVATTVRVRDGQRVVHDGPFADTEEQLGGEFVVDVPDVDEALAWAERCPASTYGSVEVRPLLPAPTTPG